MIWCWRRLWRFGVRLYSIEFDQSNEKGIRMSATHGRNGQAERSRKKAGAVQQEWQLQEAKARLSEVFRLARERGPQRVTKHGREAVVIVPAEEYARLAVYRRKTRNPHRGMNSKRRSASWS